MASAPSMHNITLDQANEAHYQALDNRKYGFLVLTESGTVNFIEADYRDDVDLLLPDTVAVMIRLKERGFILSVFFNGFAINAGAYASVVGLTPKEYDFIMNQRNLVMPDLSKWIHAGDYREVDSIVFVAAAP